MNFLNKILALIEGHITVFKHSLKKKVTLEYPEKKQVLPESFRGKPCWNRQKCIACKICEKVCPADAIKIKKEGEKISADIDLSKCIICGNCMYYCPKQAIILSKDYELATDDKNDLYLKYTDNLEGV